MKKIFGLAGVLALGCGMVWGQQTATSDAGWSAEPDPAMTAPIDRDFDDDEGDLDIPDFLK